MKKIIKKPINYAWFIPNYPCYKHNLHWLGVHNLKKASWELSVSLDFLSKGRKVKKTHSLCIIMLINPSLYDFLQKIIFDFQITTDRVHHIQISSRSDNCITTDLMWKTTKFWKNDQVSKIGVRSQLYSLNQIFPGHAVFVRC